MNLTLKQIEIFLNVAQTLSFSQAAVRCHLSQPALSANVQRLEETVGARLFDRHTRKVSLTPLGREFRPIAEALADNFEQAFGRIQDLVAGQRGRLVVAAAPSLAAALAPRAIAQFLADHPRVEVRLHDVLSDVCIDMVRSGTADVALAPRTEDADDLIQRELFKDPLVVLHREDHPLAVRRSIRWNDIKPYRHILMHGNSSVRQLVDAEYSRHGVQLRPAFEVQHVGTMLGLIEAGLGIGVLPYSLVQTLGLGGLTCRRFSAGGSYRSICSVTLQGRTSSPTVPAFIDIFRRQCASRVHMP